jgi:hypothetical protein
MSLSPKYIGSIRNFGQIIRDELLGRRDKIKIGYSYN